MTFHAHPDDRFAGPKRAAMAGHAGRADTRTLRQLLRPTRRAFERVTGTDWYRQPDRTPRGPLVRDVFAGLWVLG